MKKILLSVLCCMGVGILYAQSGVTETSEHKDSLSGQKDPLYIQLYGGINKSANENLPWTEFSKYPWSYGAFIGLGKEFTPVWGLRGALRYNSNKSRNVQECENPDTWGWSSLGLFLDGTCDISDAISKKSHKFNLKAFAGVGAAYTFGFPQDTPLSYTVAYNSSSTVQLGARLGLDATWQVAKNWRIGMELSQTLFTDRFNGVKDEFPMDARTNLGIGVTYLLTKTKTKTKTLRPTQGRQQTPVTPIVMANRLKDVPALPMVVPDREDVKTRQIAGRAFLDFPVNMMTIYPDYRKNPDELKKICASVDSALFDKSVEITKITLHGYASPESPYSNNTRLSLGRVKALKEYLQTNYDFDGKVFELKNTPEDWGNLKNFLVSCNRRQIKGHIWYDDKSFIETPEVPEVVIQYRDELLAVIDNGMDPDPKEEVLKRVGGGEPYKWLHQYVYPGLRHTDYVIDYKIKEFSLEKAKRLIYTHPEGLSTGEMYCVAKSYEEGTDGWYDAFVIAAKQYPNDKVANFNAACASVRMKRLKDAKAYLDKAGENERTRYVRDVIRAMEGGVQWRLEGDKVIVED